ncbi:MAG: hypothetical protein Q9211_003406, partial [Gyalolechia sp. 1 TL-2023]
MGDQAPSASLNAFVETRIDLEPVDQDSVVQITLPSQSTFSYAPRSQRRVISTAAACDNEESYARSCLATSSAIYFSKSQSYPRSFLWRVLDHDKVLELRSVDITKQDQEPTEATVVLQLGFANTIRKGCVALTDGGEDILSIFVLTKSKELVTLTIPTTFFCDVAASEEGPERWCKTFSHSAISLSNPLRLVAANPQQLVATLDDGGILRLNRKPDQNGSTWETLTCNGGKWTPSLRGLIRWQGNNSVRYNGTVLDPSTAIAAEFSPSRTHLVTVCVNHTLKIWNLAKGSVVFSMDLLGQERASQDITKVLLDAGNPEILRVFEAEGAIAGDDYYVLAYSPHEGGQFKIWAIRDADQGSLGIRFLHPENLFRPPDPEPGLESKAIWKVADFKISQGTWGTAMEVWLLMRSNRRYKTYSLKFDLIDLPGAWGNDWTTSLSTSSDQQFPSHTSPFDVRDVSELWLEYLFDPGRYSHTVLETALSMYCTSRKVKQMARAEMDLRARLHSAVTARVNAQQVKKAEDSSNEFVQYREVMQDEWRLLYQEVQDLERSGRQALTLSFDDHSNTPWLLFTGGCAVIRACSRLESIAKNQPALLQISTEVLEAPSIEDGPRGESELPHRLAALIQAAAGFNDAFGPSFRQACLASLSNELWQEPLLSVPKRIEDYYERCGFAEEITDSAIADLREALTPIGDFDGLTTAPFLAAVGQLPLLMTTESSDLKFSKFGLKALVKGAQEMIDVHSRILFDLLVLVVFIEVEVDRDITPKSNLDTSTVFMAMVHQLKRYKLMEWLAKSSWTMMEGNAKRLSDGMLHQNKRSPNLSVLESLFAADVRPQSLRGHSQSVILSDAIQDLLVWITGSNVASLTLHQVLVAVQCNLLKENDLDLASDFDQFQPSTAWATYIKGRFYLSSGGITEAALCFQKAAYKMAGKPCPDYHQASAGFLSPAEAAHFGQGLPFYYYHIHQLFQSASYPSYAAQFAQLALQFTSQSADLGLHSSLLASLFHTTLQSSDVETAFTALMRLPQHDQTKLLPTMVEALMALSDGPKQLLDLPWPPYIRPAIDAYLSNAKSSSAISSNRPVIPAKRQQKILAAWRLKNGDFRGAAAALYSQLHTAKKPKQRSGAIPKSRLGGSGTDDGGDVAYQEADESYLSIINLMACIGSEDDSTGNMGSDNAKHGEAWVLSEAGGGKRNVVTISDVRKGWQKELDRRSVVEGGTWGFGLVWLLGITMGRKPSQLILEYFDRGAKLEDNSNRYEHRCKACGEHFPKGRIESLTAHIDRRCPSIRRDQSGNVSSSPQEPPHPMSFINDKVVGAFDGPVASEYRKALPVSSRRRLTGLEALAEASRQLEHPKKADAAQPLQNHLIDPGLERASSVFRDPGFDTDPEGDVNYDVDPIAATDESLASSGTPILRPYIHHGDHFAEVQRSQDPAILSLIAASATNLEATMLRAVEEQQNHVITCPDPPSSQQGPASEAITTHLETSGPSNSAAIPTTYSPLGTVPGNPASENPSLDHVSKYHNRSFEKSHGRAQKVRSKFTDSRRQEVQKIRKKGACIRCRMLRKTTCASVMSARVWKLDCMRTNIYKELDIFHPGFKDPASSTTTPRAAGLFTALSSRLLEQWHSQRVSESDRCFVKVAHANRDASTMLFQARWCKQDNDHNARSRASDQEVSDKSAVFLDESTEQISITLLSHVESTVSHLGDSDPNTMIGPTLRLASTLTREGHDSLLKQTLDLWALTQVMTSNRDDWQCYPFSSRTHAEEARPPLTTLEAFTDPRSIPPESREYFTAQLKAGAEYSASTISKNIMIDLERRLERKERCRGIETTLVGILLLNCVERMCWAFECANNGANGLNVCAGSDPGGSTTQYDLLIYSIQWPFANPVEFYLHQAAHFAELLSKLYKIRGILLHVRQKPENNVLYIHSIVNPLADQWLDELKLTGRSTPVRPDDKAQRYIDERLKERREASFDISNRRCFDFRLCSQLFQMAVGIKEVQIIQWFVEPEARVEQFDKLCEVQSDKAAVEITSRFDGVVKKLHYEPEDMAQVGQPLCDIDVLSEISPGNEAGLGSTPEPAGAPSSPQQPQKAAEQHRVQGQTARSQKDSTPSPSGKHSTLATPAVRVLLKELKVDISEVTGTGKDGRVLKEDVHKHASYRSKPSTPPSSTPPSTNIPTPQTESLITLTPIQSQMFKTMTRSLSIPHFTFADELDITALSRLRTQLNQEPRPPSSAIKLSYLPFIIKAL